MNWVKGLFVKACNAYCCMTRAVLLAECGHSSVHGSMQLQMHPAVPACQCLHAADCLVMAMLCICMVARMLALLLAALVRHAAAAEPKVAQLCLGKVSLAVSLLVIKVPWHTAV